jgi:hypothetical protein
MSRLRVGWLLAGALAGCDPGPPAQVDASSPMTACRQVFERLRVCAGPEEKADLDRDRNDEIGACASREFGHPEDYRAMSECALRAGCDEFRACVEAVSRRIRLRSTMIDISRALRNKSAWRTTVGSPDEALASCSRHYAEDEELAALCDELYGAVVADYRAELEELRDIGASVASVRCKLRLEKAERAAAPGVDELRLLCDEIEAGREASATLSNVALARAYETQEVPASCAATLERLGRLATPWARGRREEVVRECYVEYGASLLPRMIARKQCRELGEVVPHLAPLAAEDPALAKALAKAARACPTSKEAK